MESYSIEVHKQNFFECCHFIVNDNDRETFHGHKYKVSIRLKVDKLNSNNRILNYGDVKKILNNKCEYLQNKILIPKNNIYIKIFPNNENTILKLQEGGEMSFPSSNILLLNVDQISAELLSKYLTEAFITEIKQINKEIKITKIQMRVYEDKDQCGIYYLKF